MTVGAKFCTSCEISGTAQEVSVKVGANVKIGK